MRIDLSIFKSYDIRGVFPETLNPEIAEVIGKAFASFSNAKKVGVGMDMRVSSLPLKEAIIRGLVSQGCKVEDFGLISTDMLYMGVGMLDLDGGIMITASHNPGRDNGIKLCGKKASPIGMGSGLEIIQSLVDQNVFPEKSKGIVRVRDIYPLYVERCLSFILPARMKPLKLVVDAGNGMGGKTWPAIQSHLPVKTIPLFFELDGTFPNHIPNPLIPENLRFAQEEVVKQSADGGIAFDGDGDRVMMIDEKGVPVSGSEATALISHYLLSHSSNQGQTILYDLRSSKIVPETIRASGGVPLMTRVGHSHIKKIMKERNALFAGELSGHYYFRDNFNADSGMMAALILLQLVSDANQPLSEMVKLYRNAWFHSGELNFTLVDKSSAISTLKNKYSDASTILEMDGITMDYGDWWFNARLSNTEPLLRLNMEARSSELLEQKKKELFRILKDFE